MQREQIEFFRALAGFLSKNSEYAALRATCRAAERAYRAIEDQHWQAALQEEFYVHFACGCEVPKELSGYHLHKKPEDFLPYRVGGRTLQEHYHVNQHGFVISRASLFPGATGAKA